MKVLIIEDDRKIASFVMRGFRQAGFSIDHAPNGIEGLEHACTGCYDAAIVDVMLPGLDGLTVVQVMRSRRISTPVIILSAKRSVDDRVRGLKEGSDDYLTKPFSFSELLARVRALIRRSAGCGDQSTHLSAADVSMDLLNREVRRGAEKIDLQPREFALLEYLVRNSGQILSKAMILEHVFGYSFTPQTNVVDVLVCRLRSKIDRNQDRKLIQTIRGVGYVLEV